MDARQQLRHATHALHQRVDDVFAAFDLGQSESYAAALSAHARALPVMEQAVSEGWSGWRPRLPLLAADLADLGRPMPPALEAGVAFGSAGQWGVQYVLEGSKLGGLMLSRRVPPALPRRYLGAAHADGSWRRFQGELNAAAETGGEGWLDEAIAAAAEAFALFERAVAVERAD